MSEPVTRPGEIPVLSVRARTLPEAWERAVVATWRQGAALRTQYDRPEDPPSRDATVVIEVAEPLGEPRYHRSFPAGLEELEIYVQEVVWGVHDSWIRPDEQSDGSPIVEGSPADDAGLQSGDIITAVNGLAIDRTNPLDLQVLRFAPGTEVTLSVLRGEETIDLPTTLGTRPADLNG